ncbi:unnamed protein product [Hymenolepis diminuta]|uniref:Uncharacterized protein n=1 Tax=Hymenolepis diminuta TaxID=6216 RepID=A0A564XY71_HYMDI|nr:unnamed protein product [Hymenolepis diminuta]VUZ52944.1 unnamed protein product [Hymenolepis diminuta]
MRCEATFLEKTIFEECYVTDRKTNPVGPERKRNLPDTCSGTFECGKSYERMRPVSTCYRNLSSFFSYSVAETRFSQNSILIYHSRPTKGATCITIINSHSKGSDVILFFADSKQISHYLSSMNSWCSRNVTGPSTQSNSA